MSMCHKAYALDHDGFVRELSPILERALAGGRTDELAAFIDANRARLTLPWEATPLRVDWRSRLEKGDVQELGDLALTGYYNADGDCGVQEWWDEIDETLPPELRACLLGESFGPADKLFDPGRIGSYFQSPAIAARSLQSIRGRDEDKLQPFLALLDEAVRSGRGLYVTF